jgi:hypothetical protein
MAFRVFKTKPNSYGVYRLYVGGRPSLYPMTRSTAEMYDSPAFEALQTTPKRPWWAAFGKSLQAVAENLCAPFKNATTYLLMHWAHTGSNSKSATELDHLTSSLQDPRFDPKDLEGFRADREGKRLDACINSSIDTNTLFSASDGWIKGSITIPLSCEGQRQKEEQALAFLSMTYSIASHSKFSDPCCKDQPRSTYIGFHSRNTGNWVTTLSQNGYIQNYTTPTSSFMSISS